MHGLDLYIDRDPVFLGAKGRDPHLVFFIFGFACHS